MVVVDGEPVACGRGGQEAAPPHLSLAVLKRRRHRHHHGKRDFCEPVYCFDELIVFTTAQRVL